MEPTRTTSNEPTRELIRKPGATYQDVLDAPEHMVAEIVRGELIISPRPAIPSGIVASSLAGLLVPPFDHGHRGPGGWLIIVEPELHLGDEVLVPDLAGWRRDRLPTSLDVAHISVVPDWICEVLSKSTASYDRLEKLPLYGELGVPHAWIIDPRNHRLEAYRLRDGHYEAIAISPYACFVRVPPFEAIELELATLFKDTVPHVLHDGGASQRVVP